MKQAFLLLKLALASCLFSVPSMGATITWASGASGNWSNTNNWNPNQVPGASDTAIITASGNYTVTVDSNVTVNALVLGSSDATTQTIRLNGQFLDIGQSATVNSNGVINVSSGTLNFDSYGGSVMNGALAFWGGTLGGVLTIASNGVANLETNTPGTHAVYFSSLILTNYGTIVWSNVDLQCLSGSQIYNYNLLAIQSDNTFTGSCSTALNNYGTVRKNIGRYAPPNYVTRFNSMTLNNAGTVDVEMGAIVISGGNGGGLFNTATNAGLSLGSFTLTGDATFSGPGAVQGVLYGQNGVIHGSMAFDYGSFAGTLTVATDGVLNLVGIDGETTPVGLNDLSLTNYGTVVWSNLNLDATGTQIYNHGLWDAQSDNTFYGNAGGGLNASTFNNSGTVRKEGGTTITHFDGATTFNNYGTVDVETAQINIDNGAGGGLFNTASNSIVWLGVPNGFGLSGNVTFTGPGRVGGNLVGGGASGGIIHGLLNFYYGSLGGSLTVASNAVANLDGYGFELQPLDLNYLSLTNCGTVIWNLIDLDCSGTQIYNHGLWDAQSDNTFYGNAGGGLYMSTFNNYGTVRKDGGSTITVFDSNTTFTNSGTVDVETAEINIDNGAGGGLFNTASNAIVWLGAPNGFDLSGNVTFTGPGLVGGNLLGYPNGGVIHGALNFYYGSLGGSLTVASNAVANLDGYGFELQPLDLNYLSLTNCGTVLWNLIDLDCSGTQIYNHGLWDAQSDNTFYGNAGGGLYMSTFNNYGTVRKDGGMTITHFDNNTTFTNSGTVDVETAEINIDNGAGGGLFNTASNAIVWLGAPNGFDLSGNVTFTGPGLVGGNLLGYPNGGVIHGSLNFYYGSLGGSLTVASNAVANLDGYGFELQPLDLNYLSLTNCGTVTWNSIRFRLLRYADLQPRPMGRPIRQYILWQRRRRPLHVNLQQLRHRPQRWRQYHYGL